MSLFGTARDVSLIRHINRELVNDIIEQQVGYYKINLARTEANLYGESNGMKVYNDPVLVNCLVERTDRVTTTDEFGPDFDKLMKFRFLRDDLFFQDEEPINYVSLGYMDGGYVEFGTNYTGYNIYPEVGDVVLWNENFYEIDGIVENQLFVGKYPQYAYSDDNTNFGSSISIICSGHYMRPERLGLTLERL